MRAQTGASAVEGRGTLTLGLPGIEDRTIAYLGAPLSVSGGPNLSTGETQGTFEWGVELGGIGKKWGFRGGLRRGYHLSETGGAYLVLRGGPTLTLKPVEPYANRTGNTLSLTLEAMTGIETRGDLKPMVGACLSFDLDAVLVDTKINIPSGRPYRHADGSSWRARTSLGRRRSPSLGRELQSDERELQGLAYLEDALDEHASVPAFQRLAAELAAHAAPRELVARALSAAAEEVRHARTCFALAAAYLGRDVTVPDLPALKAAPPRALDQVVSECCSDGCVGEAAAAQVVLERAHAATAPAERRALRGIAADERGHARLAGDVVAWALG